MTLYLTISCLRSWYFNSHPHEEDDCNRCSNVIRIKHFNSHPHEEDDTLFSLYIFIHWLFQLTSSRRGWLRVSSYYYVIHFHFNSHPHEEDDQLSREGCTEKGIFQLTSSRRGWLVRVRPIAQNVAISTHILTKRMTDRIVYICQWFSISTHILTKRMTVIWMSLTLNWPYFNSHPHEEDDCVYRNLKYTILISTHILTKRMT